MRTVQAVAWKEIQIYFGSPTAYIVGLIFLALTGFFFAQDLGVAFPEASLSGFYQWAPVILILKVSMGSAPGYWGSSPPGFWSCPFTPMSGPIGIRGPSSA